MNNLQTKNSLDHERRNWLTQLEGYLLIPHELLHLVGYKLVGKRCHYHWGNSYVTPIDPMTRNEKLVGLLFPLAACLMAWLLLFPLPFVALFIAGPTWAIILTLLPVIPFAYAFTAIGDLRRAYLLIYDYSPRQKTPFDFFFWPILAKPKEVQASAFIVLGIVIVSYSVYLFFS
jgi:hypothetical protein